MLVGFPERSADVRLAQYETGSRKPKAELTAALTQALDVAPQALDIPDIDSQIGLMHTLFALEDIYGLTISETDGEVCLKISKDKGKAAEELLQKAETELWKEPPEPLLDKIADIFSSGGKTWEGTPSELCKHLDIDIQPNALTRKLNVNAGSFFKKLPCLACLLGRFAT